MQRKVLYLIGLTIGIGIILVSIYLYFFTEKTIYSSTETAIDTPSTSVTRSITLKENQSPHNVYLEIKYEIGDTQGDTRLLSYNATLTDVKGDIVEKKSSSFSYEINQDDNTKKPNTNKESTINLFKLKTLPSGNYSLSLEIIPAEDLDDSIKLISFSYTVKSEAADINPILPLVGILIIVISIYLLTRANKSTTNPKT